MITHPFLFEHGSWLGEGIVTFSASPEEVKFFTKWNISHPDPQGNISCQQRIEMHGVADELQNVFLISDVTPESFIIEISNKNVGSATGKGVINDKNIAWEFRGHSDIEGVEVYELQEDDRYRLHAEYTSTEQYRTIIDGLIWRKER